ncbi:hypothetical protein FRB95_012228 [Tulasnella sp. JGI-2019a]|nr:hypothetical protein FRB95_012228 [Tulasnella sp. JGI-2019a]
MLCAPLDGSTSNCVVATRSVRHASTRWKLLSAGNGAYYIVSMLTDPVGTRLALCGQGKNAGAGVEIHPAESQKDFQFTLKKPNF